RRRRRADLPRPAARVPRPGDRHAAARHGAAPGVRDDRSSAGARLGPHLFARRPGRPPRLPGPRAARLRAGDRARRAPRRAAGAVARGEPAAMTRWLVDASNVIGSRPDGWWRDRTGATERLLDALAAFAASS